MELKDFAAFAGLFLGLINLGLYIYKEFLKKGKLEIIEQKFQLREINNQTAFAFQIDLKLRAKNNGITINSISLTNKSEITGFGGENKKTIDLKTSIDFKKFNLAEISEKNTEIIFLTEIKNDELSITDLKIDKDTNKSFSFADVISNVRFSDGYENTPKENWILSINYDKNKIQIPLNPIIV